MSALIDQYLDAVWLEKGLSDNTLMSYRRDLTLFQQWLEPRSMALERAGRSHEVEPQRRQPQLTRTAQLRGLRVEVQAPPVRRDGQRAPQAV